jgi:hypothetical protein
MKTIIAISLLTATSFFLGCASTHTEIERTRYLPPQQDNSIQRTIEETPSPTILVAPDEVLKSN